MNVSTGKHLGVAVIDEAPVTGMTHAATPWRGEPGGSVSQLPMTLASWVRLLGTGRSDKNDPNDARSVAIAALLAGILPKPDAARRPNGRCTTSADLGVFSVPRRTVNVASGSER
jgi:hypothetical protein